MDKERFEFIKKKYGYWASWAIWAPAGTPAKSNVGDMRVFDDVGCLDILNPCVVLVGLNISRGSIMTPLANFHDSRPEATDYKIRYALEGTPLWGGYMTDIIKDFDQKKSGKVSDYLKRNRAFEENNVEIFSEELSDIGAVDPVVVAFGRNAFEVLRRNFKGRFRLFKVPHYASYCGKEQYRQQVHSVLTDL